MFEAYCPVIRDGYEWARVRLVNNLSYECSGDLPDPGSTIVSRMELEDLPLPEGWREYRTYGGHHLVRWMPCRPQDALSNLTLYARETGLEGEIKLKPNSIQAELLLRLGEYWQEVKSGRPGTVYRIEKLFETSWRLTSVKCPVRVTWPDSRDEYPREAAEACVRAQLAQQWELQGNSGIPDRNLLVLRVPQLTVTAWQIPLGFVEPLQKWDPTGQAEVEIADPAVVDRCLDVYTESLRKAALEEWQRLVPARDMPYATDLTEFNKTNASLVEPPVGIYRVANRTTSLGNTTAIVVSLPEEWHEKQHVELRCPEHLRKYLLGRNAEGEPVRIAALARQLGIGRIQLIN